jgi:hypothetical protein
MELDAAKVENGTRGTTAIWRYMDLPRFVSMISTSTLWFSKAATLCDDPWEGFGKAECLKALVADGSPGLVMHEAPDGTRTNISVPQMLAGLSQRSASIFENAQDHIYVNSWCLDASESMAMWQIYGSLGSGVAVRSSVEQYQRAAKFGVDSSHYIFGEVTYHESIESEPAVHRDLRETIPAPGFRLRSEVLKLGLHKRSCYWYEHEWRAVIYQDSRPEIAGIRETFDLEQLISAVYVGPRAQEFVAEVVYSIMEKFLIRKPLERSVLLSSPRNERASQPE